MRSKASATEVSRAFGSTFTGRFAQAPEGGVPAMVGATPGRGVCEAVVVASQAGLGYQAGDLVRTGQTFEVINWTYDAAGAAGTRLIKVDGHYDGAAVDGWSCTNEGNPSDIKQEAT